MFRQENEIILQLKGICPDNKIPTGLLLEGKDAMLNAVDAFSNARNIDIQNEKRPD
jgi:serine/threonine-protein phosphatase 2B catalytic subunit